MSEQPETIHDVHIQWGVKIPMRDGVRLDATLYLPKDLRGPRPTVFALTPYIAVGEHVSSRSLAEHGYPCLAIDVRGRGNSEGEFTPFFNDPSDGHDIAEWLAKQPYCNGKIATRGISYVGFTQWASVRGDAPNLATIVPLAPCWVGLDYPFRFNIFLSFLAMWLTSTWGNASQSPMYIDEAFWTKQLMRFYESGLPYKELTNFFGLDSKPFREWMEHPRQAEYWDRANPTPEQFSNLTMPVLSITGQHDGDQPGTLEFYHHHLKNAGDKAQHYLVIGPWDHPGVHTPVAEFIGLKCGPDSVVDMNKLHREWYAWTMEDGAKPEFLKNKVSYYVTDAERWRYTHSLEDVTERVETLYLHSTSNPSDLFHSGLMSSEKPADAEADLYVYDPRDLEPLRLESNPRGKRDIKDQRLLFAASGRSLFYHSAPFEQDTEVSGFFKFSAWLSIDQPDTDFNAAIYDVDVDGTAMYLANRVLRARYRKGLRTEALIDTTEPLLYEFDRFFFVSRRIKKGHRLRLVLGPSHSLQWQKNYNSGKPNAEETMADARTVTVKLFHDAAHPSALHVPIGQTES